MNDDSEVITLLEKFVNGDISVSEKQKLFDLIVLHADTQDVIKKHLFSEMNHFEPDAEVTVKADSQKILNRILGELKTEKKPDSGYGSEAGRGIRPAKIIIRAAFIAASLFIAFFLGKVYTLKSVNIAADTVIQPAYNEVRAPLGSNSEVSLPDGSSVRLNAGSVLKYATDYNVKNRNLILNGEAYFKVSKNQELPLVVNAGAISIKATGTEFNVKAYEDEEIIETTLIEGKVEIIQGDSGQSVDNTIDLDPKQKAIYLKESESFTLSEIREPDQIPPQPVRILNENILISPKVDVDQVVAWTHGRLIFRGESLENLSVELQRKYDVTLVFRDEAVKKYRFSGVLLDESIEQVLKVIKLTSPIEYSISGKTVVLNTDINQVDEFSKHLK